MQLILIYGAPGTGKLTVAKALSKKINFTLFHNHIILNALSEVFGYDSDIRRTLEKEFRLRIIEEAIKANINIILTGVITRDNEEFYRIIITTVSHNNGECLLVYLSVNKDVLEKRIEEDSRKKLKKISTKKRLEEWLRQYPESFEKIDFPNHFSVDTTIMSPTKVADNIIRYYNLT